MKSLVLLSLALILAVVLWRLGRDLWRRCRDSLMVSQERHAVAQGCFERSEVRTFNMPLGLPTMYLTKIFFTDGRRCLINGRLAEAIEPGTLVQVWRIGQDDFQVEVIEPDGRTTD
jgi:hypothetical protein